MTGSSELTHANGLATGPVQAQEILETFSKELKVVSLYLAFSAQRSSFNKVVNDVYLFMKDRYFIGEVLEACLEGKSWYNCTILQVRGPTEQEIQDYRNSAVGSADEDPIFPPACLYHYQVEKFCSYNDINRVFEASASHVRRKKRLLTKGKLILFLKQCLMLNSFGIWSVQESIQQNLGINDVKFSDIFVGQPPKFPKRYEKVAKKVRVTKKVSIQAEHNGRSGIVVKKDGAKKIKHKPKPSREQNCFTANDSDADDFINSSWHVTDLNSTVPTHKISPVKSKTDTQHSKKIIRKAKKYGKPDNDKNLDQTVKRKYSTWRGLTWEERQKLKEKKKKRILMEKQKKREERLKAKAKRDEEKVQMAQVLKDRNKLREDLECEDLKAMPVPQEVKCSYLPNELFGDLMVILEFFQSFQNIIALKSYYPRGITFSQLESDIMDCNIDGPFCNIIILLLSALFKMQEDDNEVLDSDTPTIDFDKDELTGDTEAAEAARTAAAEFGSRFYNGAFFREVTLNHLTVTEVLRLHFVSCGSGRAELNSPNQHDVIDPKILRDLSTVHVCEIPVQDRISVLTCLIDQILACFPIREKLDELGEQLRQMKLEIRAHKAAEVKRNKEANAQRIKEKKEAKLKLKEGETSQSSIVPEADTLVISDVEKTSFEKELRSTEKKKIDLPEMIENLRTLSMNFNLFPIGEDRAHRRYWVFSSLPGLYVENNPYQIGPCLPLARPREISSPHRAHSSKEAKSPTRKNSPHKSPAKKGDIRVKLDFGEAWRCTSVDGCPVHDQTVPRCRWSYFPRKDDVTDLIESLNKRGFRESELRKILVRDEQWLKDRIDQSTEHNLDANEVEKKRKPSSRYSHLNCPPEASINYRSWLVLRELILSLESRIFSRCMGTLEVNDRSTWREAISNGGYDMQCNKLVWGLCNDQTENNEHIILDKSTNTKTTGDNVVIQNNIQGTNPSSSILRRKSPMKSWECLPGRVLEEKNGENYRSSCHELDFKTQGEFERKNLEHIANITDECKTSCTIKDLASAILQIAQSIDEGCLRGPLADEDDDDQKVMQLKCWEVALMSSTSFSQLFLHITLLETSIHWSKSVLNTRCVLCRRRGDGENMLLCDGCNRGHHLYCLKPKLAKVPDGDWYCLKCEPEQKKEKSNKKRKSTNSEGGPREYEKRPSKSRKIVHQDVCNACGLKYNLILCTTCPLAFHTVCTSPPLKEMPDDIWTCPDCSSGSGGATEEKENTTTTARRSSRRKSGTADLLLNNTALQDLLSDIMGHRDSWPFLQPVRKAEAPRYHIIIKKPMDFGTMKYKLNRAQYKTNSEFLADALLIFENCRMYNEDETEVCKCGCRLFQYFKKRCKDLGLDLRD